MSRRVVPVLACLLVFSSCVLPARSYGAFEEKASKTAEAVLSAVETSRLAITDAKKGHGFAAYVTVIFDEAEQDASSAQETLSSIQPPDDRSRALSDSLDSIVQPAVDALTDLRILARGGRIDLVSRDDTTLAQASKDLNAFLEEYG